MHGRPPEAAVSCWASSSAAITDRACTVQPAWVGAGRSAHAGHQHGSFGPVTMYTLAQVSKLDLGWTALSRSAATAVRQLCTGKSPWHPPCTCHVQHCLGPQHHLGHTCSTNSTTSAGKSLLCLRMPTRLAMPPASLSGSSVSGAIAGW